MHTSSPLAFSDLWNWPEHTHVPAHKTPHNTYSLLIKCVACITHIFLKICQGSGFYLSTHLGFILAIRPAITIFLLVKLWDVSQVSGLENAVAENSPEAGFYGFKILMWWKSDDQKSWSQKQIPHVTSSWRVCECVCAYIHVHILFIHMGIIITLK